MTLLQDIDKLRRDMDKMQEFVATEIKSIDTRLTNIEKAFGEWTAVAEAISKKGVTTKQFVIGILALLVPFAILAITLAITSSPTA